MNANWKQPGCAAPLHKDVLSLYTGGGYGLDKHIPFGFRAFLQIQAYVRLVIGTTSFGRHSYGYRRPFWRAVFRLGTTAGGVLRA